MKSHQPKQYLSLLGKTVLEHSIEVLIKHPSICGAVVCLSDEDEYWDSLSFETIQKPLIRARGGVERCHSVLNGLEVLSRYAEDTDWVLVHDAARPCLRTDDISLLVNSLRDSGIGGLLAVPVSDTIKRASAKQTVEATVDRSALWQAQTPQMFPLKKLKTALETALSDGFLVTDEASAMEHSGVNPVLVPGHSDNIKITRPEDLALARFYLQNRIDSCE